jgi:hypothetical protein
MSNLVSLFSSACHIVPGEHENNKNKKEKEEKSKKRLDTV